MEQALAALRAGDLAAMGALMDRSHEGGRDLYEISCPELDRLVETARAAGALGSRLTGAGFGGCTISLVREGDVPAFIERVERDFYRALPRTAGRAGLRSGSSPAAPSRAPRSRRGRVSPFRQTSCRPLTA